MTTAGPGRAVMGCWSARRARPPFRRPENGIWLPVWLPVRVSPITGLPLDVRAEGIVACRLTSYACELSAMDTSATRSGRNRAGRGGGPSAADRPGFPVRAPSSADCDLDGLVTRANLASTRTADRSPVAGRGEVASAKVVY